MKPIFKLMLLSLLLLQACKKDSQTSPDLTISGFGPVVFASGDAISIYGSGFDSNPLNNTVSFNGVNGEVATATPNRLQVIVPLLVSSGKITVSVNGKSVTSSQAYTIVNVLQGTYTSSFILTPDKKYLLRGSVTFSSKLIVGAGTVIYGEKATHGSLGATDFDFEGTADKPIIFTSDQAPGSRSPGDWGGIGLGAAGNGTGIVKYVRVEYAGYGERAAVAIGYGPNTLGGNIQASYSEGGGFAITSVGSGGYLHHIVAFGCLGADFSLSGNMYAQYALGLKDPYPTLSHNYAGGLIKSDGISIGGNSVVTNFTLVGYNPDARNINLVNASNYAGSGIRATGGSVLNSVIAGSWQAGVNLPGAGNYLSNNPLTNIYEVLNTYQGISIMIRNCYIAGTAPITLPKLGGAFANFLTQNSINAVDGSFVNIAGTPQRTVFAGYNDTTKVLSFGSGRDDLGIKTLTDYNRLNNPGVLPAAGSPLLTGAIFPAPGPAPTPFPAPYTTNQFFNKDNTFVGAFGNQDWTAPWCNFNPQITQY